MGSEVHFDIQPIMPEWEFGRIAVHLTVFARELTDSGYDVDLLPPPSVRVWMAPPIMIEIIAAASLIFFISFLKKLGEKVAEDVYPHVKNSFRKFFEKISERGGGILDIKSRIDKCEIFIRTNLKKNSPKKELEKIINSFNYLSNFIKENTNKAISITIEYILTERVWNVIITRRSGRSKVYDLDLDGKILKPLK